MNRQRVAEQLVALAEVLVSADTFKCPECGTKVLEQTGYCVKCKKKVKEAAEDESSGTPERKLKQDGTGPHGQGKGPGGGKADGSGRKSSDDIAGALVGIAESLVAKKGEVPEAFKKQWKDKDKDNDGKENEPKPDFVKEIEKKKGKKSSEDEIAAALLSLAESLGGDGEARSRRSGISGVVEIVAGLVKSLENLEDVRGDIEVELDTYGEEGEDVRVLKKQFYLADDLMDKAVAGYKRLLQMAK